MKKPKKRECGPVHLRAIRGPNPDGRWYWQGRHYKDGAELPVKIGWATVAEADQIAAGIVARDGLGKKDPAADRADTLGRLLALFVGAQEESSILADKTKASRRGAGVHLTRTVGRTVIGAVTGHTIERHRDLRIREGAAPRTVGLEIQILRTAWRWGRDGGLGPTGDLPRVRVGTATVRDRYTPTRAEISAVLGQLVGWPRLMFLLLAATGCRRGEIGSLTWDRVDLDGAALNVIGKTGARRVPIAPPIVDELREALPLIPRGFVLVHKPVTVNAQIGRFIAAACEAAKVHRFSPHGLRRAAVDALYGSGADVSVSAALLGHSEAVALKHYRQIADSDRTAAVKAARLGYFETGTVVNFKKGSKT